MIFLILCGACQTSSNIDIANLKCEALPIQGLMEYKHLLDLQFANAPEGYQGECISDDDFGSILLLPMIIDENGIVNHHRRRCLNGLDDLNATYDRSCRAIEDASQ